MKKLLFATLFELWQIKLSIKNHDPRRKSSENGDKYQITWTWAQVKRLGNRTCHACALRTLAS